LSRWSWIPEVTTSAIGA